jgi:hypothetical protein
MNTLSNLIRKFFPALVLGSLSVASQAQNLDTVQQLLNSAQSMGVGANLGAGSSLNLSGAATSQIPQIGNTPDLGAQGQVPGNAAINRNNQVSTNRVANFSGMLPNPEFYLLGRIPRAKA